MAKMRRWDAGRPEAGLTAGGKPRRPPFEGEGDPHPPRGRLPGRVLIMDGWMEFIDLKRLY